MNNLKKNIAIVCLNIEFKKKIATKLADALGMLYLDIDDFVKYDVIDFNNLIRTVGLEYYNKVESKAINLVSNYENAVVTINLSTLFSNNNFKGLKENALFIFLKSNFSNYINKLLKEHPNCSKYELLLNQKVFEERNKILSKISDIVVEIDNVHEKNVIEEIEKSIKNYYKGVL